MSVWSWKRLNPSENAKEHCFTRHFSEELIKDPIHAGKGPDFYNLSAGPWIQIKWTHLLSSFFFFLRHLFCVSRPNWTFYDVRKSQSHLHECFIIKGIKPLWKREISAFYAMFQPRTLRNSHPGRPSSDLRGQVLIFTNDLQDHGFKYSSWIIFFLFFFLLPTFLSFFRRKVRDDRRSRGTFE